ncbi:MAG TPA: class I tRNA ligase family protein, partial [Trueperaceae bacterium]|nr:class I tRNA ligase family protein [Trueperaceae bacterium]
WWGHQIPAWYDEDGNVYVPDPGDPYTDPPDRPENRNRRLRQDPDVFDTWFSSNLWPFSTLGWPDEEDPFYRAFYPNQVLVTGYDILFFWVARMEMAGLELTGRAPFGDVLLHGLVLDADGQKMSKSKGNGIDPLEVIDAFGADALRFAVTHASTGGQDVRWDDRRVEMGRNFNNKLWNAARFARLQLAEGPEEAGPPVRLADRWILSRLQRAVEGATVALEAFDLGAANRLLYDFVWSEFCDWYLEAAKPALQAGDGRSRYVLRTALEAILALLHPMVPFITSELYEALGHDTQLGESAWPAVDTSLLDAAAERDFKTLEAAVGAVRALRSDADLSPGQVVPVHLAGEAAGRVRAEREVAEALARARFRDEPASGPALTQVAPGLELRLPFEGLVDEAEWSGRQRKRLEKLRAERERSERKLSNVRFTENAPAEVVAEERRRLSEASDLIERVEAALAQLGTRG